MTNLSLIIYEFHLELICVNSNVPKMIRELNAFGVEAYVYDPLVSPDECYEIYGIRLITYDQIPKVDAILCSIGHDIFLEHSLNEWLSFIKGDNIFLDVKGIFRKQVDPQRCIYWSL